MAVLLVCLVVGSAADLAAQRRGPSGLPLPRFVSLKSNEVRMRAGPGRRYPIEWVYRRAGLPVQIAEEFDTWRLIRDFEGDEGWVHQSLLSGRRTGLVIAGKAAIRDDPRAVAEVVAWAEPGVILELHHCAAGWCEVEAGAVIGWMSVEMLWGVEPDEVLD